MKKAAKQHMLSEFNFVLHCVLSAYTCVCGVCRGDYIHIDVDI